MATENPEELAEPQSQDFRAIATEGGTPTERYEPPGAAARGFIFLGPFRAPFFVPTRNVNERAGRSPSRCYCLGSAARHPASSRGDDALELVVEHSAEAF